MPRHQAPPDIARAGVIGPPISYEWSTDVSDDILWASDEEYPSLARAMTPLSLRAGMALLAATAQWVSWRYSGLVDIDDALQRVEAGYAAAAIQRLQAHARVPDEPFRKKHSFPSLDEWKVFVGRHRGQPLPPAIIDLQADYQHAQRQALVTRFIEGLDWERNRFLRSPQAMLALGFEGEPCRGPVLPGNTA